MFINKVVFLLLVLVPCMVMAQDKAVEKINWMSWDQAISLQKTDRENYNKDQKANPPPKKLFLDIYTSWCGWCKKMDATTFKDKDVVKAMNQYYYPIKLDAEMPESISYNGHEFINPKPNPVKGRRGTHQLAASLLDNKMSYPSYVIMDENTSRITIHKGYKKKADLLGILGFFGTNQYLTYKNYVQQQKVPSVKDSRVPSSLNSNTKDGKVQQNSEPAQKNK